jgi:hypothetical protein
MSGLFPWSPANVWICGANGNQFIRQCAGDGLNNMIITWRDERYGANDPDIFAQRLDASGMTYWTGWGAGVCTTADPQEDPNVAADDFGGAVIAWTDSRNGLTDIFAQRMSAAGDRMWTWNGVAICIESHSQHSPAVAFAGPCGAVVAWTDLRWVGDPYSDTNWDIYGQRVYCDGSLSQYLTLDVPNGGERWNVGTMHDIEWHCWGIENRDVRIEYSMNGGVDYSFVAYVTQVGATGVFPWRIPDTPSDLCLVRVNVTTPEGMNSDQSDGMFSIVREIGIEDQPVAQLAAPRPAQPAMAP